MFPNGFILVTQVVGYRGVATDTPTVRYRSFHDTRGAKILLERKISSSVALKFAVRMACLVHVQCTNRTSSAFTCSNLVIVYMYSSF